MQKVFSEEQVLGLKGKLSAPARAAVETALEGGDLFSAEEIAAAREEASKKLSAKKQK